MKESALSHTGLSSSLQGLAVPASDHPLTLAHSTCHGLDDGVGIRRYTCTIEDNIPTGMEDAETQAANEKQEGSTQTIEHCLGCLGI